MRGRIWGISSFDQWGVQLGKHLAQRIVHELEATGEPDLRHDSATKALIRRYRQHGDAHVTAGLSFDPPQLCLEVNCDPLVVEELKYRRPKICVFTPGQLLCLLDYGHSRAKRRMACASSNPR